MDIRCFFFKVFLYSTLSLFLLGFCKRARNASGQTIAKKPNLLIVLSDQHSFDMLGCYGNSQIITPNLDSFASEGIRFDMAFSNQPVCTPFRGMIMSGMHPLKNGAFSNDTPLLPNQTKLLGEVLKEEGYQTAYVGKWHLLGGDRDRPIPEGKMRYGFDTLLTNNCHVDFRPGKAFHWNENGEKEYFDEWEVYGQTEQAMGILENFDKDKPFAMVVSWHPPHDWGKELGEDGKQHYRYDTLDELMALYSKDSIQLRPGIDVTSDRKHMYQGHMAQVSGVDKAFGMLMEKLADIGATENTLTIFSADHGDMLESFGAKLPKQYPYDYSNHIPLLMKYPNRLAENSSSSLLIGALDYMPTILGLLEIETEQKYDGKDLSQAILTNNEDAQDFVPIWIYRRGGNVNEDWRGVVTKDFSFAYGNDNGGSTLANVLFDRNKDPHQLNNLFHDENYAKNKDSLLGLTKGWMAHYNDDFIAEEEFEKAEPKMGWESNRIHSPIDLITKLGQ